MTQLPASIAAVLFKAIINVDSVAPAQASLPLSVPLNFSSVKNVKIFSGSYSPNQDYLYLANQFSNGDAPNFMIVVCDGQLNLTLVGTFINNVAVNRFSFFSWDSLNPATGLYLEGRTNMPQNVPCNYCIVVGQAVIT